jgi:hypothetical protein
LKIKLDFIVNGEFWGKRRFLVVSIIAALIDKKESMFFFYTDFFCKFNIEVFHKTTMNEARTSIHAEVAGLVINAQCIEQLICNFLIKIFNFIFYNYIFDLMCFRLLILSYLRG